VTSNNRALGQYERYGIPDLPSSDPIRSFAKGSGIIGFTGKVRGMQLAICGCLVATFGCSVSVRISPLQRCGKWHHQQRAPVRRSSRMRGGCATGSESRSGPGQSVSGKSMIQRASGRSSGCVEGRARNIRRNSI
jgi:hypothetical protein